MHTPTLSSGLCFAWLAAFTVGACAAGETVPDARGDRTDLNRDASDQKVDPSQESSDGDATEDPGDPNDDEIADKSGEESGPSDEGCASSEGVGNNCTTVPCGCGNVCSDVLVSDEIAVQQAFCHADCDENTACPGSDDLCVGIRTDETSDPIGMCLPTGRTGTGSWRAKIFPSSVDPTSDHLTTGFSIITTNSKWNAEQRQDIGLGVFDSAEQTTFLSFFGQPGPNEQWLVQIGIPQSSWRVGTIDLAADPLALHVNVLRMTYNAVTGELDEMWFKAMSGFDGKLIIDSTGELCDPYFPATCAPASGSFDIELLGFDIKFQPAS